KTLFLCKTNITRHLPHSGRCLFVMMGECLFEEQRERIGQVFWAGLLSVIQPMPAKTPEDDKKGHFSCQAVIHPCFGD
ncbi:MAG: hypothetical protein ACNA70_06260, partial [Brevefilum sp.]